MTKKERKLRKAQMLDRITRNQVDTLFRQTPGTILKCETSGQRSNLFVRVVIKLESGRCDQYWFADFSNGYFVQHGVTIGVPDPTTAQAA